ncbi:hypothetical protein PAMP_009636 [Pampus punctatissimus]
MVEMRNKLNTNIALINSRIDEEEKKIQKNNDIINSNFAIMRDAMMRNTEAALRDTNIKFKLRRKRSGSCPSGLAVMEEHPG